jgi:CBS domain-containing protein
MIELEKAGLRREDPITKIGNTNPVFAYEWQSIFSVVNMILEKQIRRIPILNNKNELVGIITTMDILDAFLRRQEFNASISSIMIRDVIVCEESDSIEFVLQKIKISRRGGLPILKKKKLVGVVSERDFVKYFDKVVFGKKVSEIMTKNPLFVSSSVSILDGLKSIVNTHYRRLPVIEDKKLEGIITAIDLLNYIKENKFEFEALDEPISRIMKKDVYTINVDADISEAIIMMKLKNVGGLLVVKDKKLEGIITERNILEEIV